MSKLRNDWAKEHIAALKRGETVQFRPVGNSMTGIIESGQLVEVIPAPHIPEKGQVVLVRFEGFTYLHLIHDVRVFKELDDAGPLEYLIGNNRGRRNGWVFRESIYGVMARVLE